jgi:hypothetical protein
MGDTAVTCLSGECSEVGQCGAVQKRLSRPVQHTAGNCTVPSATVPALYSQTEARNVARAGLRSFYVPCLPRGFLQVPKATAVSTTCPHFSVILSRACRDMEGGVAPSCTCWLHCTVPCCTLLYMLAALHNSLVASFSESPNCPPRPSHICAAPQHSTHLWPSFLQLQTLNWPLTDVRFRL